MFVARFEVVSDDLCEASADAWDGKHSHVFHFHEFYDCDLFVSVEFGLVSDDVIIALSWICKAHVLDYLRVLHIFFYHDFVIVCEVASDCLILAL